jgi:hypothetical protein
MAKDDAALPEHHALRSTGILGRLNTIFGILTHLKALASFPIRSCLGEGSRVVFTLAM